MSKSDKFIFLKPPIKWVGGKTQILENVLNEFPEEIENYHEIFLGGGSVLLGLLSYIKKNKIVVNGTINAYDINYTLINLYKNIQNYPKELYEKIKKLVSNLDFYDEKQMITKPETFEDVDSKESYYYWIRQKYNKLEKEEYKTIKASALFLFLNKTCFRGLFRTGKNGFNVPYGHYKNPEIINEEHLFKISELIKDVNFVCCDFKKSINNIKFGDFVYMDPPYAPENEKSFVGYTGDGFGLDKHLELFKLCEKLKNEKIKFLMSNSNVVLVRENFKDYYITSIVCRRSINSKKPDSKTKEVLIRSYKN